MDEHDRHGVKIDHCPACGGVWLGQGELDHLLAAVRPPVTLNNPDPPRPPRPAPEMPRGRRQGQAKAPKPARFEDRERPRAQKSGASRRYGRRYSRSAQLKEILEEIFDFD